MIAAVILFIFGNASGLHWLASAFVAVLAYFGLYLGLPRDKAER